MGGVCQGWGNLGVAKLVWWYGHAFGVRGIGRLFNIKQAASIASRSRF